MTGGQEVGGIMGGGGVVARILFYMYTLIAKPTQ